MIELALSDVSSVNSEEAQKEEALMEIGPQGRK